MLPFGFVSFLAFGWVLVLVGANQEALARDLGLGLAESGLLVSALSLGLGVGVVGAGPLFDRYARGPLFVGSMGLAAFALWSVDAEMGFSAWMVLLALTGVGIGAYDTLLNAVVVQQFGERSARPMTVIHAAAAIGAMGGPLLAGWFAASGDWIRSFHAAGAVHGVLALVSLFMRFPAPSDRSREHPSGRIDAALLPFAGVAFAYVGIEATLTVFAVPWSGQLGLDASRGQLGISAFWLGLLAGRLGSAALARDPDSRLLAASGFVAAGVLALGTLAPLGQVEGTLFVAGLALGCVYPLMIALAGQAFPHAQGTAAGLAAGAGALGGFVVPWLSGVLGDASGVGVAVASMAGWSLLIGFAAVRAGAAR